MARSPRRLGAFGARPSSGGSSCGKDGRQVGHEVLVVQWREGMKAVVWPPSQAETPVAL
jgi:hypothetical protein